MNDDRVREFDANRDFSGKAFRAACYAPFTSLYFDQLGFVRVCCQNGAHSVGNIANQSLDEIWSGVRINQLRKALVKYNFNLGCQYCKWQISDGNYTGFLRQFDRFEVPSAEEFWPAQMEFSISNACNLECVMCNGEWSSSIRTRREKLPPLPKVYGDEFFAELRKYLPRLQRLKFLGGEPFLAPETLRIFEMLIEDGVSIPCHVTTNGTQYNKRVERILEKLPISLSISMDGATAETVEKVRVNASFERLIENFKRFHAYCVERSTELTLTYCLMPQNWFELGDYLLFADEWDINVYVNTVIHPPTHSLYELSPDDLRPIVEAMEARSPDILPRLGKNRHVWVYEVERLRHRLDRNQDRVMSFVPGRLSDFAAPGLSVLSEDDVNRETAARERLAAWAGGAELDGLITDNHDVVIDFIPDRDSFLGLSRSQCVGRPIDDVYSQLRGLHGGMTGVNRKERQGYTERDFGFTSPATLEASTMRLLTFPRRDESGQLLGATTFAALAGKALADASA